MFEAARVVRCLKQWKPVLSSIGSSMGRATSERD